MNNPARFSAKQLAELLHGTVDGNQNAEVWRLSKIEEGCEGSLSFLANPLYTQYLYTTKASIVIVNNDFIPAEKYSCTLIRVEDAYSAFAALLEMYNQIRKNVAGISR